MIKGEEEKARKERLKKGLRSPLKRRETAKSRKQEWLRKNLRK
jgi:hypothetical protein